MERHSKVYVKADGSGQIIEVQRTWTGMPAGYTHELGEETRDLWPLLLNYGGRLFWMGPDGLAQRTEIALSASKERALVGEIVTIEVTGVPSGRESVAVIVDGQTVQLPAQPDGSIEPLELEWTEAANVLVELGPNEIDLRADPVLVTFEVNQS